MAFPKSERRTLKTTTNQGNSLKFEFNMHACIKKWPAHKMKIDIANNVYCLLGGSSLKVFLLKKSCRIFCQKPLLQCSVCVCNTNKEIRAQLLPKCFQRISGWSSTGEKVYTHSPRSISRCNFWTSFYFLEEVIWLLSFAK